MTSAARPTPPPPCSSRGRPPSCSVAPGCWRPSAFGAGRARGFGGVRVVGPGSPAEAGVVGRTLVFDYEGLGDASTAVRQGARFIATNLDPTYPTPDGLVPGAGAIVAGVKVASGRDPEVAGKPFLPTANYVQSRIGTPAMVVGDQPATDGALARQLGAPFALVLTGVTHAADLPVDPLPDVVAADLATLVSQYVDGDGT